jgi:hypothetical protein
MTEYPLIESMGLQIQKCIDQEADFVWACDLEKALQGAPVVYSGKKENPTDQEWDDVKMSNSTHTARVVCIQPIKKKTQAEAAIDLLEELNQNKGLNLSNWENDIKRILEMKEE